MTFEILVQGQIVRRHFLRAEVKKRAKESEDLKEFYHAVLDGLAGKRFHEMLIYIGLV